MVRASGNPTRNTIALGLGLAMAAAMIGKGAGAAAPCPSGVGHRPFDYARDAPNCLVDSHEGNEVGARHGRIYNVFCPGRMTKADALKVGKGLGYGSAIFSHNPIPLHYSSGWDLKPAGPYSESDIKHLLHYTCGSPARVGTHLKIEYGASGATSAKVARHCRRVNQSGVVAIGSRMDREYKCKLHMYPSERYGAETGPVKVYEVAGLLISGDPALLAEARSKNARVCVLGYGSDAPSDIQCAACKSTDKLIVRLQNVAKGAACPTGTISWLE